MRLSPGTLEDLLLELTKASEHFLSVTEGVPLKHDPAVSDELAVSDLETWKKLSAVTADVREAVGT